MSGYTARSLEFAEKFRDLVVDQAEWSQETFGTDEERGPVGALRHLKKESREAEAAWLRQTDSDKFGKDYVEELADCFLLILDAARRSGIKPMQLVEAAQAKMTINRARQWPTPTTDEPVEHIREDA